MFFKIHFFSLKVKYVQSLKEIAIDIPGQQVTVS